MTTVKKKQQIRKQASK